LRIEALPAYEANPGIEMLHCGSPLPDCSAAIYSAYQSGQFAWRSPVRFSCSVWAAHARRAIA